MKILHIDSNHPTLISTLKNNGYINDLDISSSKEEIIKIIKDYDGLILRSRFKIDKDFIDNASNLKFIARVGSGLENIDCNYAKSKNIEVISSPEGNSNAVGEHAMGLLLSLLNNINTSSNQVKEGLWFREKNRGFEIEGKTVAILGMGNTGKFVTHRSSTPDLFNIEFIQKFVKPFWLINTSRGKIVNTHDLVDALNEKKILGAGLDVIDIESSSFNNIEKGLNPYFNELINLKNVIITPHIAGWTFESNVKLSQIIIDKIKSLLK